MPHQDQPLQNSQRGQNLMTRQELADYFKLHVNTIDNMRKRGWIESETGPLKRPRYDLDKVKAAMQQHEYKKWGRGKKNDNQEPLPPPTQ